jgi:FKBP-type peptidyl-prolyl cis-trans isomerase
MKIRSLFVVLSFLLGLASVLTSSARAQSANPALTNSPTNQSGVEFQRIDTVVGTGAEAKAGMNVTVHYTGWLYESGSVDHKGKKFDSSLDRGRPFSFPLGASRVIKGWDEGVAGMKVGGKRTLIIPPAMGYGVRGASNVIPPNATLIFDVELLGVQ